MADLPLPVSAPEWRDAVAKFRLACGGPDLVMADAVFLDQHRTADIITHANGALVGAFYKAPGWSHAESAVATFTAIANAALTSTESKEGERE